MSSQQVLRHAKRSVSFVALLALLVSSHPALAAFPWMPPTGIGVFQQWTASNSSVPRYTLLDEEMSENSCDFNDYVSTYEFEYKDSYTVDLSSIPDGSRIDQIKIMICAYASGSASPADNFLLRTFYRFDKAYSNPKALFFGSENIQTARWDVNYVKNEDSSLEIGFQFFGATSPLLVAEVGAIRAQVVYIAP